MGRRDATRRDYRDKHARGKSCDNVSRSCESEIFVRSNLCAFLSNILRLAGNVVASISDVKIFLVFRSFSIGTNLGK
jgi:hypothetical protein